jgi:hypothetical protein
MAEDGQPLSNARWKKPFIRSRGAAIGLGVAFMILSIVVFHDAYEVRGQDRPFPLRIVGFPQF